MSVDRSTIRLLWSSCRFCGLNSEANISKPVVILEEPGSSWQGPAGSPQQPRRLRMDDPALDAELIALVEEAITHLAPGVQPLCCVQAIEDALRSLGCLRVMDLHILLSGDVLILQAALAPTPIMFLLMLKQLALAASPSKGVAAAAADAAAASPKTAGTSASHSRKRTPTTDEVDGHERRGRSLSSDAVE